ncbi:MAG: prolyl oligopeptidase family serine peptidase, partial [Chloroflexota bacterium]|nr:prolyl oligopeptidase family serine peptidase [Chloroflexota bacterium]
NVRTRVHEYGGGAWAAADRTIVFSNFDDNRLYRLTPGSDRAEPITPEGGFRYGDLKLDLDRRRIICVREDHSFAEAEPVNTLVQLALDGPNEGGGAILVSGTDFVSSPCLNATGDRLAWLSWNHPNMPWDGTELWIASIDGAGEISDVQRIAGGTTESVFQPGWDSHGDLVFISDRTGWWNLYRATPDSAPEALTTQEVEYGVPQWVFGMSTWAPLADGSIVCAWTSDGVWSLGRLEAGASAPAAYDLPFTSIGNVRVHPSGRGVVFSAGSPTEPSRIVHLDADTGDWTTLAASAETGIDERFLSIAEPVSWPTEDGQTAHGFFYAPKNPEAQAANGELPPLIVESHGGPTSATSAGYDLGVQFWTSRGFAVLDVNYGGSTGYGRAYRERLNGQWGVVDVDDCVSGAMVLAEGDRVDPERLAVRGGSAGGYTTLAALAFRSAFRAGASYYGIGDLEAMARDTHKFESRYLDTLVGPYPEARDLYIERSPIHHVDRLGSAMILFQGMDDKVVPPNQAFTMADAVRAKGLPVALLTFDGEGHGFRKAETIQRTVEAELSFYGQVFGFTPAGEIEPILVDNLSSQ